MLVVSLTMDTFIAMLPAFRMWLLWWLTNQLHVIHPVCSRLPEVNPSPVDQKGCNLPLAISIISAPGLWSGLPKLQSSKSLVPYKPCPSDHLQKISWSSQSLTLCPHRQSDWSLANLLIVQQLYHLIFLPSQITVHKSMCSLNP